MSAGPISGHPVQIKPVCTLGSLQTFDNMCRYTGDEPDLHDPTPGAARPSTMAKGEKKLK